jgi:hypothetical protein
MNPEERANIIADARVLQAIARAERLRIAGLPRWLQRPMRWVYVAIGRVMAWVEKEARTP